MSVRGKISCRATSGLRRAKVSATVDQSGKTWGVAVIASRTVSPARISARTAYCSVAAPLRMNHPMSTVQIPRAPPTRTSRTPRATRTMPRTRPACAALVAARARSWPRHHSMARRSRPPSRGAPGSRLKIAEQHVDAGEPREGGRHECPAARGPAVRRPRGAGAGRADGEAGRRPGRRDEGVGARRGRLALQLGQPAQHPQGDPSDPDAVVPRGHRVRDLVGEKGREEQRRHHHAGDPVARGRRAGQAGGELHRGDEDGEEHHGDDDGPVRLDRDAEPPAQRHTGAERRVPGRRARSRWPRVVVRLSRAHRALLPSGRREVALSQPTAPRRCEAGSKDPRVT